MRILVPSYGRAGFASTMDLIPSANIVVPKSQEADYRKHYGDRVISIPDHLDGNVAKKRNACLSLVDNDELFWLIDDDLISVEFIKFDQLYDIEQVLFNHWCSMESFGFGFGGFSIYSDPVKYMEYQPFSLSKPSYGAVCIRKTDGLVYDEDLGRFEDADYFLMALHKGLKVLRDNRIYFKFQDNSDIAKKKQVGGIDGSELKFAEALKKLQKRWGSVIKIKDGKMNGIKSPRKGV